MFLYTESKSDKGNLYNFSKLKKSRKWLKVRVKANVYNSYNPLKLQIGEEVIDASWHISRDFSRHESSIVGMIFWSDYWEKSRGLNGVHFSKHFWV